ncbi:MAG: cyclic nucleotide-binding domain-containing protein, partial [Bdellovibrionales bacterium]
FDHKLFTAMFHFSQILSPWAVAGLASVMLPSNVFTVILVISTFITVWELNPYVNSEIRKLIRVLLSSEERDVVSWHFETSTLINSMNPETRRQERRFIRLCTLGGVVWLTLIFALLHQAAITFGPSILKRLVHFDLATIPSAFGLVAWLITLYLVVQTLVETVTRDLIRPAWMACEVWWKKRRMLKHLNWSQPIISKRVEALPLFSHFHEQYLSMIIQDSELLSFAANQTIIRQGAPARDLFVLLEGQVEIIRMSPVGHEEWISELSAVSVFGESALLDELPRMAQVLTRKGCVVLRVPVATLRRVALEAQSVRQLEVFRNAIMVNQFFASSPVFRSLSYESIEFLSSRGTLEYFDKHQRVFHQGDTSDSLYLILRGSVSVEINGSLVKRLTQGSFFGEIALIANIPRTASITTAEPCVFFKISSDAFWEVLVQHMDLGVFIETVSESRLREDLALSIPPRRTGSDSF